MYRCHGHSLLLLLLLPLLPGNRSSITRITVCKCSNIFCVGAHTPSGHY